MRIAYLSPASSTWLHRACALERLGHEVVIADEQAVAKIIAAVLAGTVTASTLAAGAVG